MIFADGKSSSGKSATASAGGRDNLSARNAQTGVSPGKKINLARLGKIHQEMI